MANKDVAKQEEDVLDLLDLADIEARLKERRKALERYRERLRRKFRHEAELFSFEDAVRRDRQTAVSEDNALPIIECDDVFGGDQAA